MSDTLGPNGLRELAEGLITQHTTGMDRDFVQTVAWDIDRNAGREQLQMYAAEWEADRERIRALDEREARASEIASEVVSAAARAQSDLKRANAVAASWVIHRVGKILALLDEGTPAPEEEEDNG